MATQQERAELHKTIWKIANELRGAVDGWEFKAYVLGSIPAVFFIENADVNGDGVITVTDVTKIVDMVLTEL